MELPAAGAGCDNGSMSLAPEIARQLKRDSQGLVCAVIQDATTDQVLMVGWMDDEALDRTLSDGLTTFFSRSRGRLWVKGEESGNHLHVREVRLDCDGDAVLVRADPAGPTCHTGTVSCFSSTQLPLADQR